jgi:hypothetical protein|tara:strand:- start:41 stop:766 length:726 start_codon:yes stop_codon:yes gene_type:complete
LNIFIHSETDELRKSFVDFKHKVFSISCEGWSNIKYDLCYIEECGRFEPRLLSMPCFSNAVVFYKTHDSVVSQNENYMHENGHLIFTSNCDSHKQKKFNWLNWYSKVFDVNKNSELCEVDSIDDCSLEEVINSKFLIIKSPPTSVSKILFQAAAAKTFIICKSPKDEDVFKSAFENNEHITYFNNEKEKDLRYKVNSLSDEDYRDITSRALEKVKKFHTPSERCKEIIKIYKKKVKKRSNN